MIFIGIASCRKNFDLRSAARQTWLKGIQTPYAFFVGEGEPLADADRDDVIELPAVSDGRDLPPKINAMIKYAYTGGYSHLARLDDDVYARVERLLASGFEVAPFIGSKARGCGNSVPDVVLGIPIMHTGYISGCAWWLNRDAMQIVLESPFGLADVWAEDQVMSSILQGRCRWRFDSRYETENWCDPTPENTIITTHCCSPENMHMIDSYFHGAALPKSTRFQPGEKVMCVTIGLPDPRHVDMQKEARFGEEFTIAHLAPGTQGVILGPGVVNRDGRTYWQVKIADDLDLGWIEEKSLRAVHITG